MKDYEIPIDIESTTLGSSISSLLDCLTGDYSISNNSMVSFRIVNRIADLIVLTPIKDPSLLRAEEISSKVI